MDYFTQAQLTALVDQARTKVQIGGIYTHYKQKQYKVLHAALLEATNTPAIVYQAQYGDHTIFIRPLDDWLAMVKINGKPTPRFKLAE